METKSRTAKRMDTMARLGDDGGHAGFKPWRRWRSGRRRVRRGSERERLWRGEWKHDVSRRGMVRLGGSGGGGGVWRGEDVRG
jgi:hypothetical protein